MQAGASGTTGPLQYAVQVGGKGSRGFNTITNPTTSSTTLTRRLREPERFESLPEFATDQTDRAIPAQSS
jgi:hypothetical protein